MVKILSTKRLLLIVLILVLWSLFTDSPQQKGGVDRYMNYAMLFFITAPSIVYVFPLRSFITLEKILYSMIFSFFGFLIGGTFTVNVLEQLFGSDYDITLSNLRLSSVGANLIFYLISNLCSIGPLLIIQTFKDRNVLQAI
ncbi:hypothetical protein [Rufibacter hautae]|uniref:Uncharacterized protein n=1 Tax=Rufibacter hautae TaxID=2595005 RepID=A0A5B6TD09_9BACT|nr:hypothetical protein [Rufibacter hautae]KAA3436831.1 hypothetical protein FOA19_20875 [Rufibacter hautae]